MADVNAEHVVKLSADFGEKENKHKYDQLFQNPVVLYVQQIIIGFY